MADTPSDAEAIQEGIRDLMLALRETVPEIADVMDQAKEGLLTEEEAMAKMSDLLRDAQTHARFMAFMEPMELAPIPDIKPEDKPPELFENEVGRPQLNPLVQGALAERLQFDGDVPEMRTSDLPEGVKPAVSVKTSARNPIALGVMLEAASDGVENEVRHHQATRAKLIEDLEQGNTDQTALMAKGVDWLTTANGDPDFGAIAEGSQASDLALYRRGEVPAPVEVATPAGSALAALTPEERREAAYKFLSTTQGRRSAVATIRELIATRVRGGSFEVVEREFDPAAECDVKAARDWVVNIHGKGAIKETFNLIDTAAQALASGMLRQLDGETSGTLYLEVVAKNTVDVRSVGWSARLVC